MNITHVARRGVTARIYALLTIASMILSAFPAAFFVAEAAGTLMGPDSDNNVGAGSPYESAVMDASAFENLIFSFDYDSQTLDGDTPDSFTYGWRAGAVDHDLGTVNGLAGNDAAEIDSVSVGLPVGAQASDLQVYVTVNANSASDKVKLSNVTVTGDYAGDLPIGVLNDEDTPFTNSDGNVKFCHYTNENASHDYNYLSVNINSFFGGHDEDTEDIVPPFFYVDGNVLKLFSGINWDDDGMAIYRNDCVAPSVVPVDVCPNLDGDQAEVPDGYVLDDEENCVEDDPQPPVDQCVNLLENGSFEEPIVTNGSLWQKFGIVSGWLIEQVADDSPTTLELHRDWSSNEAADGAQYAELDGDHSTKVSQSVTTLPGGLYELSWAFAPRHNIAAEQNQLSVLVDGVEVATEGPATAAANLTPGDWTRGSYQFLAADGDTNITFADAGPSNTFGTFLDDAQLCLLREPEPEQCEPERYVFADNVEDHDQGLTKGGAAVTASRSNPEDATGDPDWTPGGSTGFYSLGFDGWIILSFDKYVVNVDGDDLSVHEATNGTYPLEKVKVEVSQDGSDWYELSEEARNDNDEGGDGVSLLDFDETGLAWIKYVRLTDTTDPAVHGSAADGFDLDTVDATYVVCDEPEPEPEVYTCDAGMLFLDTETDNPETMSLYTVDETDGTATFWAEYDLDLHSAMAVAADGTVYSIEEGTGNLVTLDDDMGAYTVIGNTGLDAGKPVAMEIAPDGTLYVMTQNSDNLYEVDVTDGSAMPLSNLDLNVDGGDIVFDGGYIYYVKNTGQVYEIDPDNAYAESLVGTLAVGAKRITSAASKDGTHYAFTRQDSFHAFTLNPFVEGAVELATGPFAFGDGSYCPAEEQRPEGKIKVFKWVNNQDPEDVPFEDFSFQIDDMDPISFNQWGFGYDYVPVGEEYEITEADIPEGYEHVVTVCKVIEKPDFLYKDTIKVLEQEDMPVELHSYKDALPHQILPDNTVYLEDENDLGICLVVNERDYDVPPPMCSLDIVSDTGTVVVENNAFAVPTYDNHTAWTADIGDDSDAEWVWESYQVIDPESDRTLTFKETFEVTGGTNALLEVAADNSYKAWLNGHLVIDESAEGNNFNNLTQDDEDVTSYLVDGTNTLLIEVTNYAVDGANYVQNPAGVLYRLTLDGDVDSCEVTTTPEQEPETYRLDGFKYEVGGEIATPAAGWVINLLDGEGDPLYSTTTASDGNYYFDVPAGAYQISETLQTDWIQVEVRQDGELVETDADLERCDFTVPDESDYECDFYNEYVGSGSDPDDNNDDDPQIYSSGTRIDRPTPQVLGESVTNLCPFLEDYMQIGWDNDTWEVTKLQLFLNRFRSLFGGGENPVTGVFDRTTDANVKAFQAHFQSEVLDPWYLRGIVPHNQPTGFVYKTTLWKINDIVCPEYAVLPDYTGENLLANIDIDR